MEKTELKKLISDSQIGQAFTELGRLLSDNKDLYNDLLVLKNRYDKVNWDNQMGYLGRDDWSTEINKITRALLDLIDEIEKTNVNNAENHKRKIPVEEAIEWLKNALIGMGYTFKEEEKGDNKKESSFFSSKIKEVTINDEGNFYIKDYYEHSLIILHLNSGFVTNKSSNLSSYTTTITNGNFRDISSLFIEKNNEYGCYTIRCVATNYEKKFFIKTDDKEGKSESEFYLHTEDINRAKKIKNAIDYLAIYFGRKEDAF